jgi:hypothetical protein
VAIVQGDTRLVVSVAPQCVLEKEVLFIPTGLPKVSQSFSDFRNAEPAAVLFPQAIDFVRYDHAGRKAGVTRTFVDVVNVNTTLVPDLFDFDLLARTGG